MQEKVREKNTFFCIDMKSFFASVECAERGLNPFETNLVVADAARGKGALCLAVTPKMKSYGVSSRGRLFEIPKGIKYEIAKPRMKKYIEYAADIYEIYLKYVAKEDIHVYSIDESFLDVTAYLKCHKMNPKQLAKTIVEDVARSVHIPATVGIGTNLYLAKIALDITAKKTKEHMGFLNEQTYKDTLWDHRPITDFWQIGRGTAARLAKLGIFDMKGVADCPEEVLYKTFGINAELLIDHAWGRESCTMEDIKAYKSKSKSISSSQILFEDYTYEKAEIVIIEMALSACQDMIKRKVITNQVGIYVGYSKDAAPSGNGRVRMNETTNSFEIISGYVKQLFNSIAKKDVPIRKLGISFNNLCDEGCEGYDFFTDFDFLEKERKCEKVAIEIKERFGKNAVLRGFDLQEGATAIARNKLIGGHNKE